jgi:hypothetical protein
MGQIKTEFIETLPVVKPNIFVETGTYLGGTALMALVDKSFDRWDKIYTIDLSEKCCKISSTRYKLYEKFGINHDFKEQWSGEEDTEFYDRESYFDGKLNLLHGDSSIRLMDVLNEVDQRCAFWLDAHAGGKELFARGEIDCPLINELGVINEHPIKDHFIAIDDVHLFGQKQSKDGKVICDYTEITQERVEGLIKKINSDYVIEYPKPYGQLMLTAYVKDATPDIPTSTWWQD